LIVGSFPEEKIKEFGTQSPLQRPGQPAELAPVYVLLAITLGGGLFGFWGIFLGVPVIAIFQMLLRDYLNYRQRIKKPTIRPTGWSSSGGAPQP
jgi:hypothetical protein